jgi:glycosyltransferase involved in cell wall biosynthesis
VGRLYGGVESVALPLFVDPPEGKIASAPTGPITLFHAGRIEREKGLDTLLRAMARVPDIRFRVAGNGAAKPALMELCESLGIGDRVEWLGPVDRAQVLRECGQAHLAVLPSLWVENAPVFVLEAMREGCPVAASRVGGYPDLIDPGTNGFLVERGSVEGWGRLLSKLASGFDRQGMGEAARARIASDHSPDLFHGRITDIYRNAIAAR